MSKIPAIFFVGGFLGAGKTTAIKALARIFADRGLRAAAITNDQAEGLVDTLYFNWGGLPTEEVAGSCFCCNFNGLADSINHCIETAAPDVILAEPVGSCTDIVATVVRPMRSLMKERVDVRAYSVLVEPHRWSELGESGSGPWSMKFLFDTQIQEADFVVITKVDTLCEEEQDRLIEYVKRTYPASNVLSISSKQGLGLETWLDHVESSPPGERWLQEIDYDRYAVAEAEMGWLNSRLEISLPAPIDGGSVASRLADDLSDRVSSRGGTVGHLKFLAVARTGSMKVGITHAGSEAEMDGAFTDLVSEIQITVNMRATLSPGDLSSILMASAEALHKSDNAEVDIAFLNTFRPGAPNPTYRHAM